MKIGFTTKGTGWESDIEPRFGRTPYLLVYDEENESLEAHNNSDMNSKDHGAGPGTASKLFDMKADVLITGNGPGENAASILRKANIKIYTGAEGMNVTEAYMHYKENRLNKF